MDTRTSTLSLTDESSSRAPYPPQNANVNVKQKSNAIADVHTSAFVSEHPQPAAEWFTRLVSPLTDRQFRKPSAMSTSIIDKQYQGQFPNTAPQVPTTPRPGGGTGQENHGFSTVLLIFIPVMVVILTVLIGLVIFLVAVLYMRRRKGIQ